MMLYVSTVQVISAMMQSKISSFEDLVLVRLKGRCTFSSLSQFEDVLDLVRQRPPSQYELEMSELEYIDSSGVGMLLMIHEACEMKRSRLVLRKPSPQVVKVLSLTRLDQMLTIEGGDAPHA